MTSPTIPIRYRLRPGVGLEAAGDGSWRVVSGVPLSVLRVNAPAASLLERLRGGASVDVLAEELSLSPERCLELCEKFRRRGLLEAEPAEPEDAPLPRVTVVVPTRDRAESLAECLDAVAVLDYPRDLLDVVVVDDGSEDPLAVGQVAVTHGAGLLVTGRNLGPAAARNRGAVEAEGEVLAFVDSDCVPDPDWLRTLTPYFAWDKVGAVAGRTVGHLTDSRLARYEEVSSPLDMGVQLLVAAEGPDSFYAPTCNLLVRRSLYLRLGGLREELRLGEDVDFCWRLRDSGAVLVYAPQGLVSHKHLDRLPALLRRRGDYGSSEALLHALHPDKRGRLRLPPAPAATVALAAAGIVTRRPWILAAALIPPVADAARRTRRLRRERRTDAGRAGRVLDAARPPLGPVLRLLPPGPLPPVGARRAGRALPRRAAARRRLRACTRPAWTTPRAGRVSASRRTWASTRPSTPRTRPACMRAASGRCGGSGRSAAGAQPRPRLVPCRQARRPRPRPPLPRSSLCAPRGKKAPPSQRDGGHARR